MTTTTNPTRARRMNQQLDALLAHSHKIAQLLEHARALGLPFHEERLERELAEFETEIDEQIQTMITLGIEP